MARLLEAPRVADKIRNAGLDNLSFTALDIILRRHNLSSNMFAEGLAELSADSQVNTGYRHNSEMAKHVLGTFGGFMALKHALEQSAATLDSKGLPIGIIYVSWADAKHMDDIVTHKFDLSDRFEKSVGLTVGTATANDLTIANKNIAPEGALKPAPLPNTFMLGLSKVIHIQEEVRWGQRDTVTYSYDQMPQNILTAEPVTGNGIGMRPDIEWPSSTRAHHSLIESIRPMLDYFENKASYIAWGKQLLTVLEKLSSDRQLAAPTRSAIAMAAAQLPSEQ